MAKWSIKTHKAVKGETYYSISALHKTTIAILRSLNTYPDKQIPSGASVKWMSEVEYRYYLKDKALAQKKTSTKKTNSTTAAATSNTGKFFEGLEVKAGQDGVVVIKGEVAWYEKSATGKLSKKGTLAKNTKHRVYSVDSANKLYYIGSKKWIKISGDVSYKKLPAFLPNYDADSYGDSNASFKPSTPTLKYDFTMDIYGRPYYRRPMIKSKTSKGKWMTTELRVLGIGVSISQQITPSRTNGGFFYNVAGANPTSISVSGWVMDTEGLKEFDAFIQRYKQDWEAAASGSQIKIPKTKFYWKNREYTCFIQALAFNEESQNILQVRYTMNLLVVSEKRLAQREVKDLKSLTNTKQTDPTKYYSDLANMFTNTVTGARP